MAKLFYTLEEAAQKLHKSPDEVMAMARSGQLQELKDKDQILFRRSAIDQLAAEDDGGEISLEGFDAGSSGSDIRLGGSSMGGEDLRLDEPAASSAPAAKAADDMDLRLDDSIGLSDSSAKSRAPAPARAPAPPPSSRETSDISLGDSMGGSSMSEAGRSGATSPGDSMGLETGGNANLETVGSGSGLLDISSDESFFGAQMIEESMGGEAEGAPMPGDAADIFGGGDQATTEEAAPVTAGTTGVTFGSTALAEARDPAFSGLTAGAMLVAAVALVALAWATVELTLGGYSQVGQIITENGTMVLMGLGGGVLVAGAIGFGIGKATA